MVGVHMDIERIDSFQNFPTQLTRIKLRFHMLSLHMFVDIGLVFAGVATISALPLTILVGFHFGTDHLTNI